MFCHEGIEDDFTLVLCGQRKCQAGRSDRSRVRQRNVASELGFSFLTKFVNPHGKTQSLSNEAARVGSQKASTNRRHRV